ncbi:hypothetical protein CPB86DRAFT_79634 [Serendipita vermifera]|nr:hypothetical protein CPB86DRAFT_79634 [Serendipita vermifera]
MPPKRRAAPTKKQVAAVPSTSTTLATSSEFPPGYGDIEIQSSDNIIISFHRDPLTQVSPVFKDMLSTPHPENRIPVVLEEASATIEDLLSYIDSNKEPRPLTKENIMPFFEATTKYRARKIVTKVEKMALNKKGPLHKLSAETPMFILSIAEKFRLPKLGALAMNQAIKAKKEKVCTTEYPLSPLNYVQIMEARTERATWLLDKVIGAIEGRFRYEIDLPADELEDFYYYYQPMKKRKPKHPEQTVHCEDCTQMIMYGLVHIGPVVYAEPNWYALLTDFSRYMGLEKCKECGSGLRQDVWDELVRIFGSWPWHKAKLSAFNDLRAEVLALESTGVPLHSLMNHVE